MIKIFLKKIPVMLLALSCNLLSAQEPSHILMTGAGTNNPGIVTSDGPEYATSRTTLNPGIIFIENQTWKEIKAKALKEHKMIFFDAYASWCGPCKYMEKEIYSKETVASYYNTHYINVKMDMEEGEGILLAEEFEVNAYPTFLFFSAEGKLVHKSVGALETDEFLSLGKDAANPAAQYFTLKAKADKNELSDELFEKWADAASSMSDKDLDRIVKKYLDRKGDLLKDKATAQITFYYAEDLETKQLLYLYSNKTRIGQLMEWDADRIEERLYSMTFSEGLKVYDQTNKNLDSFAAFIKRIDPTKVNFARKDLLLRIALFIDKDSEKGMTILSGYLRDKQNGITLKEIASLLINNFKNFTVEDYKELERTLEVFTPRSIDTGQEGWLYLMQWLCYSISANEVKAKEFAGKAYKHPATSKEYKDILKGKYPDL